MRVKQSVAGKDASTSGYQERVLVLNQELAGTPADIKRLAEQYTADKDLRVGVRTSLAVCQTYSQKRA